MKTYTWKPIEPPPAGLERPELLALAAQWTSHREHLKAIGADQPFMDRLIRQWSIETGIIEHLYTLTEGATQLLIQQGFDAALLTHGDTNLDNHELIRVLEDHRQAIDFTMDIIGGSRSLSVSWIKELHALLTRHQHTTRAMLPDGRMVEVSLRRGAFKQQPNNASGAHGDTHEYCPPEHVRAEMDRLVAIYETLPEAPEVRAAWLHHAFTQIHPFQDGNGRVARVLASIDLIRAGLFPLLVERTEKAAYVTALRNADDGDLEPLVGFVSAAQQRMLMQGFKQAEQAAPAPTTQDAMFQLARTKLRARCRQPAPPPDVEIVPPGRPEMERRLKLLATVARHLLTKRAEQLHTKVPEANARTADRWSNPWPWPASEAIWAVLILSVGHDAPTELAIELDFTGPATATAEAFLSMEGHLPAPLAELLLAPTEDETAQRARFVDWLDQAVLSGLILWSERL